MTAEQHRQASRVAALAIFCLLAGCGGGGDATSGSFSSGARGTTGFTWVSGVFQASSNFAAKCAAPRRGTDPYTHAVYPDQQGATLDENNWLRSWTRELYLWYSEVVDQNPSLYSTATAYFDVLKTTQTTASGNAKDRFHFTYATSYWESLSQSSTIPGYGATWAVVAATPPRKVLVAYTEPGVWPATVPAANLARGASVLTIDGVDINTTAQAGVDTLNAGLYPAAVGEIHTFVIEDEGASTSRSVTLVAANVKSTPVQDVHTITTAGGSVVGYMLFNDHLATSEAELINAFNTLKTDGVGDLILDIRYNGGGYLDIASEVAYMIAGPGPTSGQTFERTVFNDKYPNIDPVTGQALTPLGFHSTTQGFSTTAGQPLPSLNLPRVYVLTGPNTCSASESIINSLRGVNVQVIQIGSTTCGKPYGFYPADNCGTTYFSIQFKGVNAKGFGEYSDGFSPGNSTGAVGAVVPGCSVADDYSHALGEGNEARLAAALHYQSSGSCPTAPAGVASVLDDNGAGSAQASTDGVIYKSPWRENRIFRP